MVTELVTTEQGLEEFKTNENIKIITDFRDMDLNAKLIDGIISRGFEKPYKIQQLAIKPILEGRDLIAQAEAGTGKTSTSLIALLQNLDLSVPDTQVLCLSPTRKLAIQIQKQMYTFCKMLYVRSNFCIGGTSVSKCINQLESGQHVVSGTPGRVLHMLKERVLPIRTLKMVIFNQADLILNKRFRKQIYNIYRYLPPAIQNVLMTATLPNPIFDITRKFMTNPVIIASESDKPLTLDGISHCFIPIICNQWKLYYLYKLNSLNSIPKAVIYCNKKSRVDFLKLNINTSDLVIGCIDDYITKNERNIMMEAFEQGKMHALIKTDACAKGINLPYVQTVINYDLPKNPNLYLQRVGHSSNSAKYTVFNFVGPSEFPILKNIIKFYSIRMTEFNMTYLLRN